MIDAVVRELSFWTLEGCVVFVILCLIDDMRRDW